MFGSITDIATNFHFYILVIKLLSFILSIAFDLISQSFK